MPFINPIVFWVGAGAASLPVIIHLLNRRRFRIRDWAAMRFLMESLRKNRKRLRIEELILLLIRTLIVLLLAVALGRFTGLTESGFGAGRDESRTVVMILDDSYSMGQRHVDSRLFDLARQEMIQRIRDLSETDQVAVILTSRPEEKVFFGPQQLTDAESLIADLQSRELSDLRTSLSESLSLARSLLSGLSGDRELVVLADLRREDLDPNAQGKQVRSELQALRDAKVDVTVLDYAKDPQKNLTLESIKLVDRLLVANREAQFSLSVRNNGPVPLTGVKVELDKVRQRDAGLVDSDIMTLEFEEIAPGASSSKSFRYRFDEPGPVVIRASLVDDDLAGDNVRHLAAEVQKAIEVLIVDGGSPGDGLYGVSVPLETALDPDDNLSFGFQPTVRYSAELDTVDFREYDLVVLADVPEMPQRRDAEGRIVYPKLRELEGYVDAGGGLMVFTGNRLSLSFYKGPFYNAGKGLLPYEISAPVEPEGYMRIDPARIGDHPALTAVFGQEPKLITQLIRFFSYTPVKAAIAADQEDSQTGDARVLLRLASQGDQANQSSVPLLAAKSFGQGTVMMYYSTANSAWNDWPSEPTGTYVAVMQDLASSLARSGKSTYTDQLPASVQIEMPARLSGKVEAALVRYPTGDLGSIEARRRYDLLLDRLKTLIDEADESISQPLTDAASRLRQEVEAARAPLGVAQADRLAAEAKSIQKLLNEAKMSPMLESVLVLLEKDPRELMRYQMRWDRIHQGGLYGLDVDAAASVRAQTGIPENLLIARNVDPLEGRLAPAEGDLLDKALGDAVGYDARVREVLRAEVEDERRDDRDWFWWALGALGTLVLLETVLGLKFGHYSRAQKQG